MSKILFRGMCKSSDDPKRLGRIRAEPKTEDSFSLESSALEDGIAPEEWSDRDPLVYKPLLPFFSNVTPKEGEYVHLLYSDPENKQITDRFYISGVFSSPTMTFKEPYESAKTHLEDGARNLPIGNLTEEQKNNGVYINPDDISLQGRGTSDIVVQNDSLILRSGKFIQQSDLTQYPEPYIGRGFLQISKFNKKTSFGSPKKITTFENDNQEIKILIEYTVTQPETSSTGFTGHIDIFNLKPSKKVNTSSFSPDTKLETGVEKSLATLININDLITYDKFAKLVSECVAFVAQKKNLNNLKILDDDFANIVINGKTNHSSNNLPLYYRPSESQYNNFLVTNNVLVKANLLNIFTSVKVKPDLVSKGYSVVYDEDLNTTAKLNKVVNIEIPKNTTPEPNTSSILGSDTIYFISHKSKKPNAGKIDLSDSIYGITEDKLSDDIEPKTSSMVRGEEILYLLELITDYLFSHVHAYHGMRPIPIGEGSTTSIDDIIREMNAAYTKVLNQNIRIN